MSAILRHDDQFGCKSNNVFFVDKGKWMQNVIWPMADFTTWLARLLYYKSHFKTWKLRRVFDACNILPLRQGVTNAAWHDVDIPINVAIKLLSICSFERPGCASLCTTKYNAEGR